MLKILYIFSFILFSNFCNAMINEEKSEEKVPVTKRLPNVLMDINRLKDIEESVKPHEIESRGILSKSNLPISDYSANPYTGCIHACKYCYASFMNRFSGHSEPWGTYLDAKTWPKIQNPQKYNGSEIVIGTVTDPYNPLEQKFKRTRQLLTELQGINAKNNNNYQI